MNTEYTIEINNFSKSYKNKDIKLVNIIINKKVTMLIGENGSGKSTLIKAILGLISYEGEIICPYKPSFMPEFPHFPEDITCNNFLFNLGQIHKNDHDYLSLCKEFSILDKIDCKISTLSKGMKSKLNLVQCLAMKADVYILDEPLSGLDKESVKKLVSYIRNSEKSYIISSHIKTAFNKLNKDVIEL